MDLTTPEGPAGRIVEAAGGRQPINLVIQRLHIEDCEQLIQKGYFMAGRGPLDDVAEPIWEDATLEQRRTLQLAPGHVPRLDPLITLRPHGPMPMTPSSR